MAASSALVATNAGVLGLVLMAGIVGALVGFTLAAGLLARPSRRPSTDFRGENIE